MSLYLPEGFLIKTEENKKALFSFENFKEAYQKGVTVPDIKYKTLKEAETILKESGLKIKYNTKDEEIKKEERIVSSQIPSSGISINKESIVTVTIE